MKFFVNVTLLILILIFSTSADRIVRARLESCPGCKLNRLSEIKAFAYEDLPKYENVKFKKIHGASPVLLFLNESDDVVERHPLEHLTREQCNNLLQSRGFQPTLNEKSKEL